MTELPSWEIAHAQPGALAEATHHYRLASQAKSLERLSPYRSLRKEPCSDDADRQQRSNCDPYVYLITRRPAASAGMTGGK